MALVIQNLKKSYREPGGGVLPVLDIDHFALNTGDQVVLVGSSGGGKTTLLNVIAGISTPDSGTVTIDGVEVTALSEPVRDRFRAERIGIVFQTFNLLPAFTAFENVLLGMSFSGKADRRRARELLEIVGLGGRLRHRPGQLSVGEQQRVAVARGLANSPSLLLADEPTASVDIGNQDVILQLIRDICAERNVSLLLVTHAPEVASQFDRVEQLSDFNKPQRDAQTSQPQPSESRSEHPASAG